MIRTYATSSAAVVEILEEEGRVEFKNIEGIRTSRKCMFIDYEKENSEIVIHNLSEEELREIKRVVNEL
ncbi:hypothetical protein [Hathewaya massiliensis]|uniref:hypothetical protein n=1 Tax=Hathewaya massiliensis TaxID=1964382 RepID=UPI001156F182|nr:hypothetical protein [Hathewaya massiliensis]